MGRGGGGDLKEHALDFLIFGIRMLLCYFATLKTPAYVYEWTENILNTELFENEDITIIGDFPARVSLGHQSRIQ